MTSIVGAAGGTASTELDSARADRGRATNGASARFGRFDVVALLVLLALGLVNLPQPFGWDQAMFTLGARELADGAVLYRDYWDPKQPAAFVFYLLAGRLFGFSEVGIHAFELVYLLVFAAVLIVTLKPWFTTSWAAPAAALLSLGVYEAVTEDWHLTQIEGLVGLPMYLSLWCVVRGADEPGRPSLPWLFASGILGGIVLLFKFMFLPIVGSFWLIGLVALARGAGPARARAVAAASGAIALGVALVLAAAAAYFAAHRALGLAVWTTFQYPVDLLQLPHPARHRTLLDGASWFATRWSPVLGLAAIGAIRAWSTRRDLLSIGLVSWCVTGLLVLMVQAYSYWQYQYLLFMVPLGILAAHALDEGWRWLARSRSPQEHRSIAFALGVGFVVLFANVWIPLAVKAASLVHDRFALTEAGRRQYQLRLSRGGGYPKILADTEFLSEPASLPGPIFVIGNPLYYWLSRRKQAVPRNGGSFIENATAAEWGSLSASLEAARPSYIFVQKDYDDMFRDRARDCASFLGLLASHYRPLRHAAGGWWYERVGAAPASTHHGDG